MKIISEILYCFGCLWAADKFCKRLLGISKRNELLFMIFYCGGRLFLELARRRGPVPYIFLVLSNHMFFMGLVLLLFRADVEKKMLAASLFMTITTLVEGFCESFLSCLFLVFRYIVKQLQTPFLREWETVVIANVSLLMAILTVYRMAGLLMPVFYGKARKWYAVLTMPLLVIIMVIDMAGWGASNGIMLRSGGNMGVYYDQIFSHAGLCILSFLLMSAAGFYVFGMERIYLEQKKSSQYHSQIAVYKMLEEQYRQSERLRHDMKNHVIALSGLFESKEWERMGEYLKNMRGSGLEFFGDTTGNKAVDALLYQKRKQAEREHIKWECDVRLPKICRINEFELCVLFGNILDNALEACERLGRRKSHSREDCFVNIQAKVIKKFLLLEVKNSMDMTEKYVDGFTNKENPKEHGIGLRK
ncbi:MAG: GHKL domain-containing protein, partial [Lachnospiraceae bacterium]|nr:GHKL domain-containing protein [Lachnospiraceae bacterium]